jgi:hypothetical protein
MNNDNELSSAISKLKDLGAEFCNGLLSDEDKNEMGQLLSFTCSYILNQQSRRSVQTEQINNNRREILGILCRPPKTISISRISSHIDNLWAYSGAQI